MKIFRLLFLALCIVIATTSFVDADEKVQNPLQKIGTAFGQIKDKVLGTIKKISGSAKEKAEEAIVKLAEVDEAIDEAMSEGSETTEEVGESGEAREAGSGEATKEEL